MRVHKHHDSKDILCPHCHQPGPWATHEQVQTFEAQQGARSRYEEILGRLGAGISDGSVSELAALAAATGYGQQELAAKALDAWRSAASLSLTQGGSRVPELARELVILPRFKRDYRSARKGIAGIGPTLLSRV